MPITEQRGDCPHAAPPLHPARADALLTISWATHPRLRNCAARRRNRDSCCADEKFYVCAQSPSARWCRIRS